MVDVTSNTAIRSYRSLIQKLCRSGQGIQDLANQLRRECKVDFLVILDAVKNQVAESGSSNIRKKGQYYRMVVPSKLNALCSHAWTEFDITNYLDQAPAPGTFSVATVQVRCDNEAAGYVYLERNQIDTDAINEKEFGAIIDLIGAVNHFISYYIPQAGRVKHLGRNFMGIISVSAAMQEVIRQVQMYATFDEPVLVQGATGTGKELVANSIHRLSGRKNKAFRPVNCSVFTDTLAESIIMGHRKHSFTGALQDKEGIFESAKGGTIFLDEIGDLDLPLQAMLLRIIQEKKIKKLGDSMETDVDFRLLCATNKDIGLMVRKGDFREDLYYRISTLRINIPPLRERSEDILPIAEDKLRDFVSQNQIDLNPPYFSPQAEAKLKSHHWHGNIRELVNVVYRSSVLLGDKRIIDADDVIFDDVFSDYVKKRIVLPITLQGDNLDEIIAQITELVYRKCGNSLRQSAELLGISEHYTREILAGNSVFKKNKGNKSSINRQ